MSIKNLEDSFTINNQTFVGIEELGFNERGSFVVHAYMTPPPNPRGTYTTYLAISPLDYRQKKLKESGHQTGCGFEVISSRKLIIYDDWSKATYIEASAAVIRSLVKECLENEIPERES